TDFTVSSHPGILDWYTVLTGLMALATLASHGALYVATKTEGEILTRARRIASVSWWAIAALSILGLAATLRVRPQLRDNYRGNVSGVVFPVLVTAALFGMFYFRAKGIDKAAFLSSCAYIVGMLGGVAYAMYPVLLPSTTNPADAITVHNAAASSYGLKVGVVWWSIGMAIAIGYFVYLYRSFKGKVSLEGEGH